MTPVGLNREGHGGKMLVILEESELYTQMTHAFHFLLVNLRQNQQD